MITGDGPEHRFVANVVAAAHPLEAILLCDTPPRRRWYSVLRRSGAMFLDKVALAVFRLLVRDEIARKDALLRVLGEQVGYFPKNVEVVPVGRPRDGLLSEWLAAHQPDVIAVYGTGVVPDTALVHAKKVALNLHTGISPRYRGTGCAFWPIFNSEPEWVGATIHECTSALDGGPIFATCRAMPRRGDNLHDIFARAVIAGAQLYAHVIFDALSGTLAGREQDVTEGHEYSGTERGFVSEILARIRLKRLQRRLPK